MSDSIGELATIFRGGTVVFLGNVLGRGFNFLGHLLIANALLPTLMGRVGIAFTVVSTLGTVSLVGIPKAIPRLMSEANRNQRDVIFSGYTIALSLGSVSSALVFLFADHIAIAIQSPGIAPILKPFSVFILLYALGITAISGLRGCELSSKTVLIRDILGPILPVGFFIFLSTIGDSLTGAVIYYLSIHAIVAVAGTYVLIRRVGIPLQQIRIKISEISDLLAFSWPLALSTNLILLMNNFDLLMIGYFLSSEPAGYYKAIQPLGMLVLLPLTSFTFLFLPIVTRYFEKGDLDFLDQVFTATTKWISLIAFPLVLVLILFPESVIRLFFRPEYSPAATALAVYALGMFTRTFVGPNGAMIKAINRTRVDLVSAVIGALTNVLLNIAFIPRFGIEGAALATGLGFLMYNLTEVAVIYNYMGIHPFALNSVKPLVVTAIAAMFIQIYLMPAKVGIAGLFLFGVGITAFELFSLVATRSLDESDYQLGLRVCQRIGVDPSNLPRVLEPNEKEK